MKIKTSELEGVALNWAVAKCEGWEVGKYMMSPDIRKDAHNNVIGIMVPNNRAYIWYSPSTDWAQGGPIIEREGILFGPSPFPNGKFAAGIGCEWDSCQHIMQGSDALIAAMRCYVASELGEEVEIPDELVVLGETK
jgi:hypothetical protein